MIGLLASAKPRRAEEDDRVLNLLAAETGEGLEVLRDNANEAPIRPIEKVRILVRQRCALQRSWSAAWRNFFTVSRSLIHIFRSNLRVNWPFPAVYFPSRCLNASWNAIHRFKSPKPDMMPRTAPLAA